MPTKFIFAFLLAAVVGRGVDGVPDRARASRPIAVIESNARGTTADATFTNAQRAYVSSWIREQVPEASPQIASTVAEQVLEDLQLHHPDQLDRLLAPDFSLRDFQSTMLRLLGAQLAGSAQSAAREAVARRRVEFLLTRQGGAPTAAPGLIAKIRDESDIYYRRLLEGRMDDDELELWLGKVRQSGAATTSVAPAKPRVLSAADVVVEFSRRNQQGSALQRLRAYTIEGRLRTASGVEQHLLVFRLRPDRFRLVVQQSGTTRYVLSGNGAQFWQQVPGRASQFLSIAELGDRRYLGEFVDPLLAAESYGFERLPDGVVNGRACYRIAVRRPDGSGYIACIDTETYRAIGRENADKSTVRYADFRDVAGVTMAFSEEVTDREGRKATLLLNRVTPNPGLVQAMFEPPADSDPAYFQIERGLAQAPSLAGATQP